MLHELSQIELELLHAVRAFSDSQFIADALLLVSSLGDAGLVWIVIAAMLLIFPHTRRASVAMLTALFLNWLICNVWAKPFFARLRPCDITDRITPLIECPSDFSFPSGHTSSSFAAALALMVLFPRAGCIALAGATLMAFSRLYLFVHFPSDVIAGALLGLACGISGARFARRFMSRCQGDSTIS